MENQPKPNFPKGGTFFSGDKKPEMITDKKGNQFLVAEVKVSKVLQKQLLSIKKRLKNIPIIKV